tara:strand:+ start:376 stop:678 length:303 start_codon:yes stop_codon:yes gene_type:complete
MTKKDDLHSISSEHSWVDISFVLLFVIDIGGQTLAVRLRALDGASHNVGLEKDILVILWDQFFGFHEGFADYEFVDLVDVHAFSLRGYFHYGFDQYYLSL